MRDAPTSQQEGPCKYKPHKPARSVLFVWWWAKGGGLSLILGSQTPNTGAARVLCGTVLCFDSFCVLLSFSVIFMILSLSRAALSGLVI